MGVARYSMGVFAALFLFACAVTPDPVFEGSSIAGVPIAEMRVFVSETLSYMPLQQSVYEFTLPKGEYVPVAQDEEGVYFQAPKTIEANDASEPGEFRGGILKPAEGAENTDLMLYIVTEAAVWQSFDLPAEFKDPSAGKIVLKRVAK